MSELVEKETLLSDEDSQNPNQGELDFGEILKGNSTQITFGNIITPRVFAASSLFTTRNKNQPRELMKNQPLYVAPGVGELTYRGEELRMVDDNKVWHAIIRLARKKRIHQNYYILETAGYELLTDIGWPKDGRRYTQLKECLERLKATALTATVYGSGNQIKSVSLISKFVIEDADSPRNCKIKITLDIEIYKLFSKDVDVAILKSRADELSVSALKTYNVVVANDFKDLPIETHMQASGSKYKHLRQYTAKLKKNLKELVDRKLILDWNIETGMVSVTPSK